MADASAEGFTSKDFRATVGAFATGVTVVTTRGEEHAYGMTANAFSSVSLDPPLVLVCVMSPSEGSEHIERNALLRDQHPEGRPGADVAATSPPKTARRGATRSATSPHRIGASGSPILDGAIGYLDCRLHDSHDAGDHLIFIGEVLELGFDAEGEPLVFHGGRYKSVAAA